MSQNTLIIPAIVAITVFLLYMLAMQITNKQDTTQERLRRLSERPDEEGEGRQAQEIADPLRQELEISPLASVLQLILRATGANLEAFRKHSQMKFYQAGMLSPNAPIYYLFFKRIGFILFIALAFYVGSRPGAGMIRLMHLLMAGMLVFAALMGPDILLRNQRDKRAKVLQRSFPDALDLLLVCVESGLALDGALSRVCKELGRAHPEITQELNRTRLELTLLNDRAQALTNLAERTDMLAFRSLVTTLLQSEKFGTSLTDTLRVLSEDFRNTRLMLAEEKAGRLPVLMTIPLITLLLPALFLIIMGPAILSVIAVISGTPNK